MRKIAYSMFFTLMFNVHPALANYEVERLMESYLVAKADAQHFPMTEAELKITPYTIQVASYINEKDAVSHVEELKLQEKEVLYFPSFVRGQVWFKVCVGKFDKKDKAEDYRKAFVKRMDEPFAVVISLLDRPKSQTTTASVQKPAADKIAIDKEIEKRTPASVAVKKSTIVPVAKTHDSHAAMPAVKLIPKAAANDHGTREHIYSIQVGAFNTEKLVKEKLEALNLKEHRAYYKPAMVNGQQWYRLFVGKFESKKAAEEFQKEYQEKAGGAESFIRRVTASE